VAIPQASSSGPRPTSVFASFVRMVCQLRARWRILDPFRSSSITLTNKHHDITAENEERIIPALRHRERVCRTCLLVPVSNLQKLVAAIDKEFAALDYLYIGPPTRHNTILRLPKTFRAPHLRHLIINMAFPIGCSLLTSAVDSVALSLDLPIRLLSPQSSTPAPFKHASDGGSWDGLSFPSH